MIQLINAYDNIISIMFSRIKMVKLGSYSAIFFLTLLVITSSRLVIHSPDSLVKAFTEKYKSTGGQIPFSIANYGDIPYGKILNAEVAIPSVLQDCIVEDISSSNNTNMFLLTKRGDCKFVDKSLVVQKQGGKMAIIMDSVLQNPYRFVMIDDGRGSLVHIPTILISLEDGNMILNEVINKSQVMVSMQFTTNKKEKADVIIWFEPQHKNYIFFRKFQKYFQKIKPQINMTIRYPTSYCKDCTDSDCFFQNKYCKNMYSYGDLQNGREMIKEQLRQQIIFWYYPDLWWNYILKFDDQFDNNWSRAEQLSIDVMKLVGINGDSIIKKLDESFKQDGNSLLEQNEKLKKEANILYYPTIIINGLTYRGTIEAVDIFDTICNSLQPMPSACRGGQRSPVSYWIWIVIGCILLLVFLIFLVVCYRRIIRRKLSKDINKQVNELVNQYITMYQNDKFSEGTNEKQNK